MSIASYKAVLNHFAAAPVEVRQYFVHLPELVKQFPWEVSVAYQFVLVERAQNRALYGGAAKLHRAHADVAYSVIGTLYITRPSFLKYYEAIFGHQLPVATVNKLKFAESVRDSTVHGKHVSDRISGRL